MKKALLAGAATLSLCYGSLSAATVVYDNGWPDGLNGSEATYWLQAEDFALGANTQITGANVYIGGSGGIGNWGGTIEYFFFSDGGGKPTAGTAGILDSGSGWVTTVSDTGIPIATIGGDVWELSFNIAPFTAQAWTPYWFGIHLASDYTSIHDIYWITTDSNGTASGRESHSSTLGNWYNNYQEHAFQLTSVHLPAAVWLFGSALAGLTGLGHRRRTSLTT